MKIRPSINSMQIISVIMRKGGSCKSTGALSISGCLAELGYRVLIIDLDDQENSTENISCNIDSPLSIKDLLVNENVSINDVLVKTEWENIYMIPGSDQISGTIRFLDNEPGGHNILNEKLSKLEGFDFCIIDTSPSLTVLTTSAMVSSNFVFMPLSSRYLCLKGLKQSFNAFAKVKKRLKPSLRLLGIGILQHDVRNALANEVASKVKESYPDLLFETVIGTNIKLEESLVYKKPITDFAPQDRGAVQYREFTDELLTRIEKHCALLGVKHG